MPQDEEAATADERTPRQPRLGATVHCLSWPSILPSFFRATFSSHAGMPHHVAAGRKDLEGLAAYGPDRGSVLLHGPDYSLRYVMAHLAPLMIIDLSYIVLAK